MSDTFIKHAPKKLLYLQCLKGTLPRGVLPLLCADSKVGSGHQPCLQSCCFQYLTNEITGSCFSIGAGDANGVEMPGWVVIKGASKIGQCNAYILHFYIGERQRRGCPSW